MASASELRASEAESPNAILGFINELIFNPVKLILTIAIAALVYKIYKKSTKRDSQSLAQLPANLPKLRKDMTPQELRQYDGSQPDGRVLLAVNGFIFDVTRGRRFYGPGGPYAAFGGKDASRGLATFSVTLPDREYDDLSDLNSLEMESVREWEAQIREQYDLVGRLLKPGEEPRNYSDEEPEDTDTSASGPVNDKKNV